MTTPLLPCPFCGGRAYDLSFGDTEGAFGKPDGYWIAGCDEDDCDIQPEAEAPTREEAARQWNRRAQSGATP